MQRDNDLILSTHTEHSRSRSLAVCLLGTQVESAFGLCDYQFVGHIQAIQYYQRDSSERKAVQ